MEQPRAVSSGHEESPATRFQRAAATAIEHCLAQAETIPADGLMAFEAARQEQIYVGAPRAEGSSRPADEELERDITGKFITAARRVEDTIVRKEHDPA